jgi:hypothetical protein
MEIDSLSSLVLSQDSFSGSHSLIVVDGDTLQDPTISAKFIVPEHNGVAVAMLVPAAFWRYGGTSSASLSGTVFLRLTVSRRLPSSARVLRAESSSALAFQVNVGLAALPQYDSVISSSATDLCLTFAIAVLSLLAAAEVLF